LLERDVVMDEAAKKRRVDSGAFLKHFGAQQVRKDLTEQPQRERPRTIKLTVGIPLGN
jgi:hypothetical protein